MRAPDLQHELHCEGEGGQPHGVHVELGELGHVVQRAAEFRSHPAVPVVVVDVEFNQRLPSQREVGEGSGEVCVLQNKGPCIRYVPKALACGDTDTDGHTDVPTGTRMYPQVHRHTQTYTWTQTETQMRLQTKAWTFDVGRERD